MCVCVCICECVHLFRIIQLSVTAEYMRVTAVHSCTCVSRECTMDTARLSRTIVGFPDPLRHTVRVVIFAMM